MLNPILLPIIWPLIGALIVSLIPKKNEILIGSISIVAAVLTWLAVASIFGKEISYVIPWAGFGMDFALRNYQFSSFITGAAASFAVLLTLYSASFMIGRQNQKLFFIYLLITLSFVIGAALSDNLVLLLFFWEGLLITLFGMIFIGGANSFGTAIKAFTISGVCDVTMMVGLAITVYLSGTFTISQIHLSLDGAGGVAFTCLMVGAIAKAGSMPFHSWIPDAALDAPLPFMAFLPAALEKLLGIYFLSRISLDMFALTSNSWVSIMLMVIGSITILLAVLMALIQKDYKRLLSYHAISQVGYMILGIGTAVPAGIVGGIFHMINHAMYKSCLFLSGGSVEKQTGTTDLSKLGGLARMMPITFACFFIAAASISGVPPFNGFFSKELIYDATMQRGWIFYGAAALGSFLTAASFLKLGHSAYFGKSGEKSSNVKESSWPILVPMITIATLCVIFGVWNALPLHNLIQPVLGVRLEGNDFAGWPTNSLAVLITFLVLVGALIVHWYNANKSGSGLKAADYIHYAPVFHQAYDAAEKRWFDPYDIGLKVVDGLAIVAFALDRGIDWIYGGFSAAAGYAFSAKIRQAHNGNYSFYLVWSVVGALCVIAYMMYAH